MASIWACDGYRWQVTWSSRGIINSWRATAWNGYGIDAFQCRGFYFSYLSCHLPADSMVGVTLFQDSFTDTFGRFSDAFTTLFMVQFYSLHTVVAMGPKSKVFAIATSISCSQSFQDISRSAAQYTVLFESVESALLLFWSHLVDLWQVTAGQGQPFPLYTTDHTIIWPQFFFIGTYYMVINWVLLQVKKILCFVFCWMDILVVAVKSFI